MDSITMSCRVLSRRHPRLRQLIKTVGDLDYEIPLWRSIDDAVVYAVIGQMLSNAAADSIISGLKKKFQTSGRIILWAAGAAEKSGPLHGISERKRKAFSSWLEFSAQNGSLRKKWTAMPLDEYRKEVSSIWGFGRWSADMIAIFYLARKDVWPESDTGIKRATDVVFGRQCSGNIEKYVQGHETAAALYLWELLNKNLIKAFEQNG